MGKLQKIHEKYYNYFPISIFEKIIFADPTSKTDKFGKVVKLGKYSRWVITQFDKLYQTDISNHNSEELKNFSIFNTHYTTGYLSVTFLREDLNVLSDALEDFNSIKSQIPQKDRDINRYKSVNQFYQKLNEFRELYSSSETQNAQLKRLKEEATFTFLDSDNWKIVVPFSATLARLYGAGSRWCTTSKGRDTMFYNYAQRAPLIIFIDKKENKKYQWHAIGAKTYNVKKGEFGNELNIKIDSEKRIELYRLLKRSKLNELNQLYEKKFKEINELTLEIIKLNLEKTAKFLKKRNYDLYPNIIENQNIVISKFDSGSKNLTIDISEILELAKKLDAVHIVIDRIISNFISSILNSNDDFSSQLQKIYATIDDILKYHTINNTLITKATLEAFEYKIRSLSSQNEIFEIFKFAKSLNFNHLKIDRLIKRIPDKILRVFDFEKLDFPIHKFAYQIISLRHLKIIKDIKLVQQLLNNSQYRVEHLSIGKYSKFDNDYTYEYIKPIIDILDNKKLKNLKYLRIDIANWDELSNTDKKYVTSFSDKANLVFEVRQSGKIVLEKRNFS